MTCTAHVRGPVKAVMICNGHVRCQLDKFLPLYVRIHNSSFESRERVNYDDDPTPTTPPPPPHPYLFPGFFVTNAKMCTLQVFLLLLSAC